MTIGKKLTGGGILLVILICGGVGLISYRQAQKAVINEININAPLIADYGSRLVRSTLDYHLGIASELANNSDMRSMNWRLQRPLLIEATERLGYMGMGIISTDGTAYYPDGKTAKLGDRGYFKKAMSGKANFSNVIISRVTNSAVMIVAAPVYNAEGAVGAVLLIRLNAAWLSDITDKIKYGEYGSSFIIDAKGTVVAHENRTNVVDQYNLINKAAQNDSYIGISKLAQRMINKEKDVSEVFYDGAE